ncbi:hypothetical protein V5O48_012605, partial [Marasmius crinis-equi]
MPPSRNEPTIRSSRRAIANPIKYRTPFEDDEPIVRHRPALLLTADQRRTLNKVSRVFDGLDFGMQFEHLYEDLGKPECSQPLGLSSKPEGPRPPPLNLHEFESVKTLGEGESCSVVLVRTIRDSHQLDRPGSLFAMKTIAKKWMREFDPSETNKDIERSVLTELPWNPFVAGLLGTFLDSKNLYLAVEFTPAGNFRDFLREHAPLSASAVQFFTCGIVAGLGFLHEYDIMHRDMKPENVLIGPGGYPVLVDFGCARRVEEDFMKDDGNKPKLREWERPGSIPYTPPENIDIDPNEERPIFFGPSMDWWAAGCMVYEMATRRL